VRLAKRLVRATGRALLSTAERERLARLQYLDEGHGYDLFGLHPDWVALARAAVSPFYSRYFRVTAHGTVNLPNEGPAILVANHAGTLPIDAAMLCFDVLSRSDPPRIPRTVVDHFVPMLPFVGTWFGRLGAINGSVPNVRHVLERGELCLIFPEGMPAIGKPWRHRYRLQHWRIGHAELAMRCRVPVIPVAIIGSEEQWPQLGRVELGHPFGIPYLPIVATPLPLPVHYQIHYGTPLRLWCDGRETFPSTRAVEQASAITKQALQSLLNEGLAARKGVYR
jgi:1-acyl-sn-glycerol-3-phosphate acyltransferase